MKILHLSSFDIVGGAARAAYRIHQGLEMSGVDSQMLVQYKKGSDRAVSSHEGKVQTRLRSSLDALPLKLYPNCEYWFSPQWFPDTITAKVKQINPDIINLNWICSGYLRIETLPKFNKPLIWTLQDMWAFTGGCHYSSGCDHYLESCGKCPQLQSLRENDLSRWVWARKSKAWKTIKDLTIVAPSAWMASCARSSSLFQDKSVEVIPFGLDTNRFRPLNRHFARDMLNLPQDKRLVLFGALNATSDTRKGFHLLQEALNRLHQSDWQNQIELVIFGASSPEQPIDLGFPCHYTGHLQDDLSLQVVYAAADVMVAPSIEEAFGQTASEALACGTPVIVFRNTGLQDIVDHQENGYVTNHCDTVDLAHAINWVLDNPERHQHLCVNARTKAEREYSMEVQAQRYLSLFHKILHR